jgi:hypothetical protein
MPTEFWKAFLMLRKHFKKKHELKLQRNVVKELSGTIPCHLCSQELHVRRDKHGKPYFVCETCCMQVFVRGKQGIENLAHLIDTLREHDLPFREHARVLYEVQALLSEIRGLEKELEALDSVFDVFASERRTKDKERVRESLNARIDKLLLELERIAHSSASSA